MVVPTIVVEADGRGRGIKRVERERRERRRRRGERERTLWKASELRSNRERWYFLIFSLLNFTIASDIMGVAMATPLKCPIKRWMASQPYFPATRILGFFRLSQGRALISESFRRLISGTFFRMARYDGRLSYTPPCWSLYEFLACNCATNSCSIVSIYINVGCHSFWFVNLNKKSFEMNLFQKIINALKHINMFVFSIFGLFFGERRRKHHHMFPKSYTNCFIIARHVIKSICSLRSLENFYPYLNMNVADNIAP